MTILLLPLTDQPPSKRRKTIPLRKHYATPKSISHVSELYASESMQHKIVGIGPPTQKDPVFSTRHGPSHTPTLELILSNR